MDKDYEKTEGLEASTLAILALCYIENPKDNLDIVYLKKAFEANSSIENGHNYAFWLREEYGEDEQAIRLQQNIIARQPKSYYPYASYAQMLNFSPHYYDNHQPKRSTRNLQQVIEYYRIADEKFLHLPEYYQQGNLNVRLVCHNNIGNAYVQLGDFKAAYRSYNQAIEASMQPCHERIKNVVFENRHFIELNKVRLAILEGNNGRALEWLKQVLLYEDYCELDVATLYAMLGDYHQASYLVKNHGLDIHQSWEWIWYAIYHADRDKWHALIKNHFDSLLEDIDYHRNEIKILSAKAESDSLEAKLSDLPKTLAELNQITAYRKGEAPKKPTQNFEHEVTSSLHDMHFGCLLFGCWQHQGLKNDDMELILVS